MYVHLLMIHVYCISCFVFIILKKKQFEETREAIRSRKSKNDRQYNGQKKNDKSQTTIYKTLHRRLKIGKPESQQCLRVNPCAPEG